MDDIILFIYIFTSLDAIYVLEELFTWNFAR